MSGHRNKHGGFKRKPISICINWHLSLMFLTIGGGEIIRNDWKWVFHFEPQIFESNTNCSDGENQLSFQTNEFLLFIFNNKTGYPKGAVQQMEVEIATLYNTMHVNLQETDRPEFGAEAMDLNMATGLLCTVVRHCLHFKIYICFDSSCHMFFPPLNWSLLVFQTRHVQKMTAMFSHANVLNCC